MKKVYLILSVIAVLSLGCGGTQLRDPSKARSTMEWGPRDIKTTTKTMADSIYGYFKNTWKGPALVRVMKIRNNSSQHINKGMLVESIVESLIEQKIAIEENTFTKATMEEIGKGQAGLIDENFSIPIGSLRSPNFYLAGRIDDNVRYQGGKEYNYLVVSLKLINAKTNVRVWSKRQEFYKVGSVRKFSW